MSASVGFLTVSLCDRVLGDGKLLQFIVVLSASHVTVGCRLLAGCALMLLLLELLVADFWVGSWPVSVWALESVRCGTVSTWAFGNQIPA